MLAWYKSNDLETSLLFLSFSEKMKIGSLMTVKHHHLSGLVLSEAGRHNDALIAFFKALHGECKDLVTQTLHYISREYEILWKACPEGCLSASLQTDYIDTLQHLVEVSMQVVGNPDIFQLNMRYCGRHVHRDVLAPVCRQITLTPYSTFLRLVCK